MPFKSVYLQFLVMGLLIVGAVSFIVFPKVGIIRQGEEFIVQIMLAYLVLGFFFLILNNHRLVLTSFFCCGILCLFLKNASNSNLMLPRETQESSLSLAHINVSSVTEVHDSLHAILKTLNADVISFQEVTPDWEQIILKELSENYPYKKSYSRIDPFGKCIISKFPISFIDTFNINNKPNVMIAFQISDDEEIFLLSTHLLPPLDKETTEHNRAHLSILSSVLAEIRVPFIVAGDFNLVYWANEIRSFRNNAKLSNSRRAASKGGMQISYDHIFYSKDLECSSFKDITHDNNHWGISGTYQRKTLVASNFRRKASD